MIYTFQSKASGSVIMTDTTARQIFQVLGRAADAKGILTPEQLPAAISALRDAIARDKAAQGGGPPDDDDGDPIPGLAQRAFTLLELLERAAKKGTPVVWGV